MFVFQMISAPTVLGSQASQTLAQMESQFLKITEISNESLGKFHTDLVTFSANNTDSKSQAFVYNAAIWGAATAKSMDIKELAGKFFQMSVSSLTQGKDFAAHSKHYEHLMDVTDNCRTTKGLSMPAAPIYKLVEILDKAWKIQNESSMAFSQVSLDKNYFVFANKAQADEFIKNILLSSLPADFKNPKTPGSPESMPAADVLGAESAKSLVKGAHVVAFTCSYKSASDLKAIPVKSANVNEEMVFSPTSLTQKRMDFGLAFKSSGSGVPNDLAIADYSKNGGMTLSDKGNGDVTVNGLAELYYGAKYCINPVADASSAKEIAVNAIGATLDKYGIVPTEPIEKYLASDEGQRFIKMFNNDAPEVKGSASMEVFYDGKNYPVLAAAIKDNWKLATSRSELVRGAINELNQSLISQGLETLNVQNVLPSVYFFQDLPSDVIDKLLADKNLPTDLKNWLSENRGSLNGKGHLASLLDYVKNSSREDAQDVYGKIKAAADKPDFTLMNTLWQRTSKNAKGLRVEGRGAQSLLAEAIEDSGNGSSRSASISVTINADLKISMAPVDADCIEVEKGKTADFAVKIAASPSFESMEHCINAYLVDSEGKVSPLPEKEDEKGTWLARNLAPGDYAVVAYAQSDNAEIITPLVGQKIRVEELPEPEVIVPNDMAIPRKVPDVPRFSAPSTGVNDVFLPSTLGLSSNTPMAPALNAAFGSIEGANYDQAAGVWVIPNTISQNSYNSFVNTLTNSLANDPNFTTWCPSGDVNAVVAALMSGNKENLNGLVSPSAYESLGALFEGEKQKIKIQDASRLSGAQLIGEISISKSILLSKKPKLVYKAFKTQLDDNPYQTDLSQMAQGSQLVFREDGKKYTAICEDQNGKEVIGVFRTPKPLSLSIGMTNRAIKVYDKVLNATSANVNLVGRIDFKNWEVSPYIGVGLSMPTNKSILKAEGQDFYINYPLMAGFSTRYSFSETLRAGLDFGIQHVLSKDAAPFRMGQTVFSIEKSIPNPKTALIVDVHLGQQFFDNLSPSYFAGAGVQIGKRFPITIGAEYMASDPMKHLNEGVPKIYFRLNLLPKGAE